MYKVSWPYALLLGYYVGNLFVYCYHGDGSDGRHVCTKYQATMLEIVINCLRLFVVAIYCYHGDGSAGRQSITAIHTTISRLLCWK